MLVETEPLLSLLREWIAQVDIHAPHRLPLLLQAERIVSGAEQATTDERQRLAERIERWRYSHLDACRERPSPLGGRLADALDMLANHLCGRPNRPPRWPRDFVHDTYRHSGEVERAGQCLDANVPLATVMHRATQLTREHFAAAGQRGPALRRRMLLYAPLYLSSYCVNSCSYCGFRYGNDIARRHLSVDEAVEQATILMERGLRHLLLVAGDFPRLTSTQYFADVIAAVVGRGARVAVEIAPQTSTSYAALAEAGACGVTLYQETYDLARYGWYHPHSVKTSFDWRLEGLDRAAEAGMQRLGLGILLGLAPPQEDLAALVRHAMYLHSRFPDRKLAFSLPRIHAAPAGFVPDHPVDDETFIRMYCGLRCALPEADLVLSTREPPALRDRLAQVCITQLSAGSSTAPGGYDSEGGGSDCGGQFPVIDHRQPAAVAGWLETAGFEVRWDF